MKITTTKIHNNGSVLYVASKLLTYLALLLCTGSGALASSTQNMIESVKYNTLPGNRLQIILEMSTEAVKPLSFTIDNPARIAFDFTGTGSLLPKKQQPIGIGYAQSMTTISAKNKTRVIVNMTEVIPYQVYTEGKLVYITLDSEGTGTTFAYESTNSNS